MSATALEHRHPSPLVEVVRRAEMVSLHSRVGSGWWCGGNANPTSIHSLTCLCLTRRRRKPTRSETTDPGLPLARRSSTSALGDHRARRGLATWAKLGVLAPARTRRAGFILVFQLDRLVERGQHVRRQNHVELLLRSESMLVTRRRMGTPRAPLQASLGVREQTLQLRTHRYGRNHRFCLGVVCAMFR